jgi:hypothetical protein
LASIGLIGSSIGASTAPFCPLVGTAPIVQTSYLHHPVT